MRSSSALRVGVGAGGPGQPERGVELVEAADGLDLRVILGHALSVEEAGRAVVTGAGGDGAGHGSAAGWDAGYVMRRAAACARRQSSAALKAWACVMACSVRLRQSRMSSPKKRKPTLPATLMKCSPFSSTRMRLSPCRSRADVHVFAQLDVALGAENDRAAVAPGAEAVGREPVDADVVRGAVVAEEATPRRNPPARACRDWRSCRRRRG